jgi:Zn-dependent M28 family amino/carboxypeptidase
MLAERGKVMVKATVDTRYYAGVYPYVTGVIPGSGPEEALTLGHSSEQGAEDNATGVSAMLESLATLERLIAAGKLPPPKRSIRILTMGELYGSMHYVAAHPERMRRTIAALCMDTPAASYDLAGTEYTFYMNPRVAETYTDAFILRVARSTFLALTGPGTSTPL